MHCKSLLKLPAIVCVCGFKGGVICFHEILIELHDFFFLLVINIPFLKKYLSIVIASKGSCVQLKSHALVLTSKNKCWWRDAVYTYQMTFNPIMPISASSIKALLL